MDSIFILSREYRGMENRPVRKIGLKNKQGEVRSASGEGYM